MVLGALAGVRVEEEREGLPGPSEGAGQGSGIGTRPRPLRRGRRSAACRASP